MRTSVIVPVLYEEPRLRDTLARLTPLRDGMDLEILIVVDVPDAAREVGARSANDPVAEDAKARVEYRVGQRGFGSAIRHGFQTATGDVLIPFMADVCDEPDDIPRLVEGIERGADIVAGSRYMRGGRIVGNTLKQRISRFYSRLVRWVGGPSIHDVSNAFKAYRREVVEAVPTQAQSFDISVELTVKAWMAGFRIREIPSVWTNRQEGRSHFVFSRELKNYGRWLRLAATGRRTMSPAASELRREA